jgi:hypothetical protein
MNDVIQTVIILILILLLILTAAAIASAGIVTAAIASTILACVPSTLTTLRHPASSACATALGSCCYHLCNGHTLLAPGFLLNAQMDHGSNYSSREHCLGLNSLHCLIVAVVQPMAMAIPQATTVFTTDH